MAAASLREFIIDTLKEFYSRLSKKVGNVYITSYIGPLGEQPFNTINDVYDWIRRCKEQHAELYVDNGKAHFAKCQDGSQYLLTSNIAEYESLVDPNRKVKVKQPAFRGRVIVKKAIPVTAAPGSVYLIHPNEDRQWIPIKVHNAGFSSADVIGASESSVGTEFLQNNPCCFTARNLGDVFYDPETQTVTVDGNNGGVFPICLPELSDGWYTIKILKPLLEDGQINFDSQHIQIRDVSEETNKTYETTCKLKFYDGKLHYDEQSLFSGVGYVKPVGYEEERSLYWYKTNYAEALKFQIRPTYNNFEIHTLKRTSRCGRKIMYNPDGDEHTPVTNTEYYNHCIFAAKIVGDNVIIYRRSEHNTNDNAPRAFTGIITTRINGHSVSTTLTNDTRKIIEVSISSYGLSDEEKLYTKTVAIRINENNDPSYFKVISEFKPNFVKISRGYKKLKTKNRENRNINTFTNKKSGKYLYYKKFRGVKSPYPAILHVTKKPTTPIF